MKSPDGKNLRRIELQAADKDEAKLFAEKQAMDIALEKGEPRYELESVEKV